MIPCDFEDGLLEIENTKNESFFVGKYITERSFHNNFDNTKTEIILNKNGDLEINKISSKTFKPYTGKEKIISVGGKWRLVYVESRDSYRLSLSLKFEKKDSFQNQITSGKFHLKDGEPVFIIEIGDPDECRAVRFIKQNEN